jgi:hypothetical protein
MSDINFKEMCNKYDMFYEKVLSEFQDKEDFERLVIPSINDYIKVMRWKYESDQKLNEFEKIENDNDDYLIGVKNKEKKIKKKQRKALLEKQLDELERSKRVIKK